MRKCRKIIFRTALAGCVLAGLVIFVCLDTVDYRPYFREPFYVQTRERVRSMAATNQVVRGELLAGFGKARLTPEINAPVDQPKEGKFRELPLAGYGNRNGRPATGVHDDLFVKAVAVRVANLTVIVFATDALIVPREIADAVASQLYEEVGLQRGQLYFSATHTHCGIGAWGEGYVGEAFAGKFNPGSRIWFIDRFVTAAREALGNLKPARFGHGSFQEPRFVRNRLVNELGSVDSEFSFLVFQQVDGQAAVIGSYAAHATVLSGRVMEFSGDYPGYWQREVEQATGGQALFVAGPVGSHGPVAGEGGFAGAERMGKFLAGTVIEKMKEVPLTNIVSFGVAGVDVALPELNIRVVDHVRIRPWLSEKLFHAAAPGSFLQVLRLNQAVWISTPCDFSGELALDIKNFLNTRGFRANVTSFNGDYIGYVVRSCYYHMDGYEPRLMSLYGPYVPDYLDELIRSLALCVAKEG